MLHIRKISGSFQALLIETRQWKSISTGLQYSAPVNSEFAGVAYQEEYPSFAEVGNNLTVTFALI